LGAHLVILDRDGVINADRDDPIKSVDEWVPLPGSLDAVARLSRAGVTVALATNQSGIARGLFDHATLAAIHTRLNAEVERRSGRIEPIVYAPQGPDSPDPEHMRKPGPGMLLAIARRLGVTLDGVPFVGDSWADVAAARAAGARPVLVRTGNGEATLAGGDVADAEVHADLAAFVDDWLVRRDRGTD
jgi:D-glycero-D-manno-heptose 1,7-bisphosphate phosphatase